MGQGQPYTIKKIHSIFFVSEYTSEDMNLFEKLFCFPSFSLIRFLVVITVIQFWWIAIWGLAYMGIEAVAGKSKNIEFWIYITLLIVTVLIIQLDPSLLEKL